MAAKANPLFKQASSVPPLDPPIDLVHLSRMTLGDRTLEREVLQLFERQARLLLARMDDADSEALCALAHTLKGSARGIGAWRAGDAAESVELAACGRAAPCEQLSALREAVENARGYINEILASN